MIRAWSGVIALICILGLGCSPAWAFDLPKPKKDDPNAAYAKESEETLKIVEPLIEKALSAYNKDDSTTFYADFAKSMASIATDQTFKALYGGYKDPSATMSRRRSSKRAARLRKLRQPPGLASYDAEFEKNKAVKLTINYTPEDDTLKLMQVQFNVPGAPNPPPIKVQRPPPRAPLWMFRCLRVCGTR